MGGMFCGEVEEMWFLLARLGGRGWRALELFLGGAHCGDAGEP